MIPIVTTAVGDKYIKQVEKFVKENPDQDFYILTDKPEELHHLDNVHLDFYFYPIFNYFDNFLYGLSLIEKLDSSIFLWHGDQLEEFYRYKNDFDIESNVIQYRGGWAHGSNFWDLLRYNFHTQQYWNFFYDLLLSKRLHLKQREIPVLWEAHMFFPKQDYSGVLKDLEELKMYFTQNSRIFNTDTPHINGNGEGLAVGYSLWNNSLEIKDIMDYSQFNN